MAGAFAAPPPESHPLSNDGRLESSEHIKEASASVAASIAAAAIGGGGAAAAAPPPPSPAAPQSPELGRSTSYLEHLMGRMKRAMCVQPLLAKCPKGHTCEA